MNLNQDIVSQKHQLMPSTLYLFISQTGFSNKQFLFAFADIVSVRKLIYSFFPQVLHALPGPGLIKACMGSP